MERGLYGCQFVFHLFIRHTECETGIRMRIFCSLGSIDYISYTKNYFFIKSVIEKNILLHNILFHNSTSLEPELSKGSVNPKNKT